MTATEYQVRVAEVLNLFDIEAVADETGVYYGGEGVALEDQPLLAAIRVLIGRRFGVPEDLHEWARPEANTGDPSDLVSRF